MTNHEDPSSPGFGCSLILEDNYHYNFYGGYVEIKNNSNNVLYFKVYNDKFENLDLLVCNHKGDCISSFYYGSIFSNFGDEFTWVLKPQEIYRNSVCILGNVLPENRRRGKYSVVAVYKYIEDVAISEKVDFNII